MLPEWPAGPQPDFAHGAPEEHGGSPDLRDRRQHRGGQLGVRDGAVHPLRSPPARKCLSLCFFLFSCFSPCPADGSCLALLQFFKRQTIEDANLVFEDDLPEFTQDELLATPTDEPKMVAGEGGASTAGGGGQPGAGPGVGPDAPRD